ncbi:hypothetical protein SESBI_22021 [Sesbania bispinosa]|nr:hypothetical protein SESBI_22021 [Sesbania bispinosa]
MVQKCILKCWSWIKRGLHSHFHTDSPSLTCSEPELDPQRWVLLQVLELSLPVQGVNSLVETSLEQEYMESSPETTIPDVGYRNWSCDIRQEAKKLEMMRGLELVDDFGLEEGATTRVVAVGAAARDWPPLLVPWVLPD